MALHQHQASLESILDFSGPLSLSSDQRNRASRRFYQIVNHFDVDAEIEPSRGASYNRPRLIRLTYEYALSEDSRDLLLQAFFRSIRLDFDDEGDVIFGDGEEELRQDMIGFAEYLMDNFFLPLKAAANQTPQPSPACHSAVLMVQGSCQDYTTTPTRIAALRGTTLVRDLHRCVISHAFDAEEGEKRMRSEGVANAKDDDGNLLSGPYAYLEVAHIIPHSLMRPQEDYESRQAALAILNMFDIGVARLIEGTLRVEYHRRFGTFKTFFTQIADREPHTYRIESFELTPVNEILSLPVIRTLRLSPDRNIDPPSSRLLAVHRAIAHILQLSGAGEYIDRFLSDMDDGYVRSDGSTQLDRFVRLRLGDTSNSGVGVH
ncbi:hypothetical protein GGS23DRAFT_612060 [Durotheca rogersii]|uniref:uncharacterized protein n=1 Tax=Durotheca rogersii TaxID=419775 RepID=UPI0022206F48|nr:uncharacterized protein GGS23DRAFT_612060 [Durotheca rogersii]KAI5861110.1 hypothetical protein GGS23DRAFT_612060 [Durotheca rogersii]